MNVLICCIYISLALCGSSYSDDVSTCFDGWLSFEGSCYLFGHVAGPFTEARHYCEQHHNSHLIHIESDLENRFIKQQLRELKPQIWYMGLTDVDDEGTWKWFGTDNTAVFTDWDSSQPGREPYDEDCAVFWKDFDFRWVDVRCENNYTPICEMRSTDTEEIIG